MEKQHPQITQIQETGNAVRPEQTVLMLTVCELTLLNLFACSALESV
jgi:hypothetical protein